MMFEDKIEINNEYELYNYLMNERKYIELFERRIIPTLIKNYYKNNEFSEYNTLVEINLNKEPNHLFNGRRTLRTYLINNENIILKKESLASSTILNLIENYYKKEIQYNNFESYILKTLDKSLEKNLKETNQNDLTEDNKILFKTKKELREFKEIVSKSKILKKKEFNILIEEGKKTNIIKNLKNNKKVEKFNLKKEYKINNNYNSFYEKIFNQHFDKSYQNLEFYIDTKERYIEDNEVKNSLIKAHDGNDFIGLELKDILGINIKELESYKTKEEKLEVNSPNY